MPDAKPKHKPAQSGIKAKPSPHELARAIPLRRFAVAVSLVAVLAAFSVLDHAVGVLPVDDDWHRYHNQTFDVLRVIDGDTFVLAARDGDQATTTVRLWGVNTPELAWEPGEEHDAFAEAALRYTKQRINGQPVTLYLQKHITRGRFGRIMAYVELSDGSVLNQELLKQGLAKQDDRWGHDQVQAYVDLEHQARTERVGQWGD